MRTVETLRILSTLICLGGLFASPEIRAAEPKLIRLPVRVFRMASDVSPKIHCTLNERAITNLFAVANESWAPAGIEWTIESVREVRVADELARQFEDVPRGKDGQRRGLQILARTYSPKDFLKPGFNVVIVESLGPGAGGVFRAQPNGEIVYGNISPRGIAVPAILAHEFGHSLSLPHTIFETNNNLMMGSSPNRKPTRTKPLTASQIALACAQAAKGEPFRPQRFDPPAPDDELFAFLDRDNDGSITVAENEEKHRAYVRSILRLASRAPHDSLTRDEYVLMQLRTKRNAPPADARKRVAPSVSQIFTQADADQDGKLSAEEARGKFPPRNFKLSDRDGDGFVTKKEMIDTRKRFGIDAEGFRSNPPAPDANGEALSARLEKIVRDVQFHGSVAVARDGEILFAKGYGMADHRQKRRNAPDTRHPIGSVSKQFTAMAILNLEEQGRLKVEDPVGRHLPDLPAAWKPLTIHQLLTHTSGLMHSWALPAFAKPEGNGLSLEETLKLFHDQPLLFEPGSDFRYSGVGYFLLARLIEKISGETYATFLEKNIFTPLGMTGTGAGEVPTDMSAVGYSKNDSGRMEVVKPFPMLMLTGGGNLYSTAEDLIRWDAALRDRRLISAAGYEKLFRPEKNDYAYGWFVKRDDGRTIISHSGGIPGHTAYLLRWPKEKICVVALANLRARNLGKLTKDLAATVLEHGR